jgi:hypothetical protein
MGVVGAPHLSGGGASRQAVKLSRVKTQRGLSLGRQTAAEACLWVVDGWQRGRGAAESGCRVSLENGECGDCTSRHGGVASATRDSPLAVVLVAGRERSQCLCTCARGQPRVGRQRA